jgi:hypothetical protein
VRPEFLPQLWRAALVLGLATACTPPEELPGDVLQPSLDWEELSQTVRDAPEATDGSATHPGRLPGEATLRDTLPAKGTAAAESLTKLLQARALEGPVAYAGGVLGSVGAARLFVATTDRVHDDSRLWWVMVRLLSEKYACFMTHRQTLGERLNIGCRDGRRVSFWRSRGPGWLQFVARQFDREGYEIVVRQHRIVRISNVAVF